MKYRSWMQDVAMMFAVSTSSVALGMMVMRVIGCR